MNDHAITAVPPPRRWRRLKRLASIALVVVVIVAFAHLIWLELAKADLEHARRESIASGLIGDLAAIIPPPCPDQDNAALLYQQAMGALTRDGRPYIPAQDGGSLGTDLRTTLQLCTTRSWKQSTAQERQQTLALLEGEKYGRIWPLLATGATLPRCRFPDRFEQGRSMRVPQISLMHTLTWVGRLHARLLCDAGRAHEGIAGLADLLVMLRQELEEPLLMPQMVRNVLEVGVLLEFRDLLAQGRLGGCDLSRFAAATRDMDRRAALVRALVGQTTIRFAPGVEQERKTREDVVELGMTLTSAMTGMASSEHYIAKQLHVVIGNSWLGTPLRIGDLAADLQRLERIYTQMRAGSAALPMRDGVVIAKDMDLSEAVWCLAQRDERLAQVARCAMALMADAPHTVPPGITQQRLADGSWELVVTSSRDYGLDHEDAWHVPAR